MKYVILLLALLSISTVVATDFATSPHFTVNDKIVSVTNFDYVYGQIYLWNGQRWEQKLCSGETIANGWVADCTYNLEADSSSLGAGTYYMAAFACNWDNGAYHCNDNKWMLTSFTLVDEQRAEGIISELAQMIADRSTNFIDDQLYDTDLDFDDNGFIDGTDFAIMRDVIESDDYYRVVYRKMWTFIEDLGGAQAGDANYIPVLDIDGDNKITNYDMITILQAILNGRSLEDQNPTKKNIRSAIEAEIRKHTTTFQTDPDSPSFDFDLNGDGAVNSNDEIFIRNFDDLSIVVQIDVQQRILDAIFNRITGFDILEEPHNLDFNSDKRIRLDDVGLGEEAFAIKQATPEHIISMLFNETGERVTNFIDSSQYHWSFDFNNDDLIDATDMVIVRDVRTVEDNYLVVYTKITLYVSQRVGASTGDENYVRLLDVDGSGDITVEDRRAIQAAILNGRSVLSQEEIILRLQQLIADHSTNFQDTSNYHWSLDLNNDDTIDGTDFTIMRDVRTSDDYMTVYSKMTLFVSQRIGAQSGDADYLGLLDLDDSGDISVADRDAIQLAILNGRG